MAATDEVTQDNGEAPERGDTKLSNPSDPKQHASQSSTAAKPEARSAATTTKTTSPPPTQVATTMAVEPVELDDFGLPIRKYNAVDPESAGGDGQKHSRKWSFNKRSTSRSDTSQTRRDGSASRSRESSVSKKKSPRDHDSESDEFEDAPSKPPSATATRQPSIAEEPRTPTIPKTTKDAPSSKLDGSAAEDNAEKDTAKDKAKEAGENAQTGQQKSEADDVPTSPQSAKKEDFAKVHAREASKASNADSTIMGEFSHQQLTNKPEEKDDDGDGGWQTMPAYAPYNIYDEDNKLVAIEHNESEDEKYRYGGLGGAGKGYTRVIDDDDADSVTSMDDNTRYLFNKSGQSTALTEEDEAQRDAVSQLQATKDLLTEGQRVAYVGLTRLELAMMCAEVEKMEQTRRTKKGIRMAGESIKMWSQKMMIRLYAHMDISTAEQVMIEQLSEHGVLPQDLTPLLMANARVKNPMAEDEAAKTPLTPSAMSPRASISSPVPSPMLSDEKRLSPKPSEDESFAEPPPAYEKHEGEEMPDVRTPSQLPTTSKIDIDLRWTVLCDLFLVLIADSVYDARARVLLERVSKHLEIPWVDICRFEKRVTDALEMQQNADKENWNEDEHKEVRRKQALKRRYVMMGLATVGGGLVIGLSAGLMAPLIGAGLAAGFTTIGVGGTGTFLAGTAGAAIITSGAAASGGIIGVRAANRRTGAVKTFEYRPLHNNKRVNLIVTVAGWMTGKVDDVRLPFSTVDAVMGDIYSVLWEPELLTSMGDTINILATEALTQGLQQVLGSTLLVGLMAALQLPVVLTKLSYLIDNPWAVSLDRATMAGLILADSIIDRNLGTRPITLVGYSLGSRVIFSCLQELSKKGAFGLVQNVFLFGSPVVVKKDEYLAVRSVVAGRFLNGYNRNDWILGYLFRLTNGGIRRVAGLAPVTEVDGVENMDCTEWVVGHMDYRTAMPRLLRECGWLVESDEFTEIEDPDPENHTQRQRELISEIEEARRELEKEGKASKGGAFSFFSRKKKAEKQDWEIYGDDAATASKGAAAGGAAAVTDSPSGTPGGVLFDVDAIRAELAKEPAIDKGELEVLQVKELQSTLPPMRLSLGPGSTPNLAPSAAVAAPPYELHNPRDSLRETRSMGGTPSRLSYDYRSSHETPSYASSPYAHHDPSDDGISMTFDTSFDDAKTPTAPRIPDKPSAISREVTPAPSESATTTTETRPAMQTSQTMPNITISDPWADEDDPDFGKEKEISMTFA